MKYKVGDRLLYSNDGETFTITRVRSYANVYVGDWRRSDGSDADRNVEYDAEWVEGMLDGEVRFVQVGVDDYAPSFSISELRGTDWDENNEVRATSESGGQKGRKPEAYSLIPAHPLSEVARVYGYGATKYSPDNWRSGYPYSWSLDALFRHVEAFRRGENQDPESGHEHLAHAAFHLFTLMQYTFTGVGEDDRYDAREYPNA